MDSILVTSMKPEVSNHGRRGVIPSPVKPVSLLAVANCQLKSCLEKPFICTPVSDVLITTHGLMIPLEMDSSNYLLNYSSVASLGFSIDGFGRTHRTHTNGATVHIHTYRCYHRCYML